MNQYFVSGYLCYDYCMLTKNQLFLGAMWMDGNAKTSIDLEDDNCMDDLKINRDTNPLNEEAWKLLVKFL